MFILGLGKRRAVSIHIVEPYNSHAEPRGKFPAEDFDYRDAYNEINGWRALEH